MGNTDYVLANVRLTPKPLGVELHNESLGSRNAVLNK